MGTTRASGLALVAVAVVLCWPAAAFGQAPRNDHYLGSFSVVDVRGDFPAAYQDARDTTTATTQPDLFNPDKDGAPLEGGGPENTRCGASSFGNTVWYDLAPPIAGGAELSASGFDTAIAVYEYDVPTARIRRLIACVDANTSTAETMVVPGGLKAGRAYTVQVGGVASASGVASGLLTFTLRFFPDRDSDDVLDSEPDRCLDLPGIEPSGCPPALDTAAGWKSAEHTGSTIRLRRLFIPRVPPGAVVRAQCRRCGLRQTTRPRRGSVRVPLTRFVGPRLPVGGVLVIRVTRPASGSGRFRHGAIGTYLRYRILADGLSTPLKRCLLPGSSKPRRTCR